ncbi:MAG TPA: RusA family crossover junction endodeoxyribonuclease [Clostridiaceae bacterium]|nr:RusA family crossover junction endodeoxyribonuclease [Clostridiaceae bacterium]
MTIEFFLPIIPPTITKQQHRVTCKSGKPIFYEQPELIAVRSRLLAYLGQHKPPKKYTGPVQLVTKWCYPLTTGRYDGQYKTTRPDTDNMIKLLKDCMTKIGYWTDDSLVVSEITEKFWAEIPGIYICIRRLDNDRSKARLKI